MFQASLQVMVTLSPYERSALEEIRRSLAEHHSSHEPGRSFVEQPLEALHHGLSEGAFGQAVERAIEGALQMLNDASAWSVRTQKIHGEFRKKGHPQVADAKAIQALDLEEVDQVARGLMGKYRALAAAEGAAIGAAGFIGMALDVPALVCLNLRGLSECASYYGFSPDEELERDFVLKILTLSTTPFGPAKQLTLGQLRRMALGVAHVSTSGGKTLVTEGLSQVLRQLAARVGQGKLARILPVVGGAIAAGYNAWYTGQTMHLGWLLYRQRFLISKYGQAILT